MVQYSYDRYGRPIKWNVEWTNFDDDHREDLFHSTVGIHESTGILRTCNLIIDHEATINLVSAEVVDNFKLPVITHPYPYSFRWFKDGSNVKVTKQVLIHFKLGNFTDKVLCDIVPMKVHHLLLGMPWLDEKCVMYDGSSTQYSIDINGKRTRFTSMTQQRAFQTHKEQEVRDAHRENALRDEIDKKTTIEENVLQLLIKKSVCDDFSLVNDDKGVAINFDDVHDPVISTPEEFVKIPDLQADIAFNFEAINVGIKDEEDAIQVFESVDLPLQVYRPCDELVQPKTAGFILQIQDVQASHISFDPFEVSCIPLQFVIADFYEVAFKRYERVIIIMFISPYVMLDSDYVGLLPNERQIFVFDPGGFEDESFSKSGRMI